MQTNGNLCCLLELLRVKGNALLVTAPSDVEGAEACFSQSLELSRRQGARGWELRNPHDLAALWTVQG